MIKIKKNIDAGQDTQRRIKEALDSAFSVAEQNFNDSVSIACETKRMTKAIEQLSSMGQKASTGFTNIVTCLAIKVANPQADIRYHQVQIQQETDRPAGFNFRGVSENVIYPWLNERTLDGAKSGWQTRTFERPKPYTLDYAENIGDIKDSFLVVFDEIEALGTSAETALQYLMYLQIINREAKKITLSIPRTQDIQLIVQVFRAHFFHQYKASKGASRLPVLALFAIYSVMKDQLARYQGTELRELEAHSAADSQTGAVGDIEIVRTSDGTVFEALEVKHDMAISERIIRDVQEKVMNKTIDRYYVLTTSASCEPSEELQKLIDRIKDLYKCQLIVNGVIPTIRYYLRLLIDPSAVFPKYVELLAIDKAIGHEHREIWNKIAMEH